MNAFIRRQVMRLYDLATRRHILTRLNELNRSQWFDRSELMALQHRKLHHLLTYAYQYVPYYRRTFDQVGFNPDDVLSDLTSLRKLPLLTKTIIRENFDDIMTTESKRRGNLSRRTTGGSTGHPLIFMVDTNFRDYFTADLHRHLMWGGGEFGQPHAYIGGANFDALELQSLRTRLMNWVFNRFTINAYILSEKTMRAFAERLRYRHPSLIYGYASTLYYFAKFVRQNNYDDIKFKSIFSSAEVLYPYQRQFIEETFGCRVFDRYASLELGEIGSQCEGQTGLHISMENVYVEILDDNGQPTPPREPGNIVITNLNNYGMPFIRYSIEDTAAWSTMDRCSCGRELPLVELVQGRCIDMFKTRDGRLVWGGFASPLFGMEGVKQFQLVQKSLGLVLARIVKEGELEQSRLAEIERTVHIALGDEVKVEFEFPDEIPVLASGKYRYAISEVESS